LIANPPNSVQLEGNPYTIPPSYIWVPAVMWTCGEGQTDTQTDTDARDQYTFLVVYDSREM